MSHPKVLVIGSTNIDFIMKVAHLPATGETVTDGAFMQTFGGKGANQAVAAARALACPDVGNTGEGNTSGGTSGGGVTFVTCLGNDVYAPTMKANFAADGMDVSRILDDQTQPSGTALIMIGQAGGNYLTVAPGSNYALTPAHIDALESVIAAAGVIVLQMEIPVTVNERALALAQKHGRKVIFNYAPTRGIPLALSQAMSVLVVNENEAAELLGRDAVSAEDAPEAGQALRQLGPATVVITLGSKGLVAVDASGVTSVAGRKVKAVDTTAAGDTFCGSLAVALAEGQALGDALRFANAAAALATTKMGAQPSIPTRDAIMAQLQA